MLTRKQVPRVVLILLTLAAIFGTFAGTNEPVISALRGSRVEPYLHALHNGNSIIFNLAVGYLVSVFTWFLVAYIPERNRIRLLRENLSRRYQEFRKDTIQILLWAAIGTHDSQLPEDLLLDHRKFREFFDENRKERWYAALNGLQSEKIRVDELLLELELVANEVSYVLNNVQVEDPKVHSFFRLLCEHISRLKSERVYSYEQVKHLGGFLWEIHARWNIIDGQREDDVIEDMIRRL